MDKEQYIGITEAGEVAFRLDIFDNLYKGNIIITKRLTAPLIEKLVENKDKIILHLTVTGMGGTKIEPMVPPADKTRKMFDKLLDGGFPVEHVVLRIDPIIPTQKGLETAKKVIELFKDCGIKRVRVSFLDMYGHVKQRFNSANVPLPYVTFHEDTVIRKAAYEHFEELSKEYGFELEACGEPDIKSVPCLSKKDIEILGLKDEIKLEGKKDQRSSCSCPANKKELIVGDRPHRCENKCLYCYWKD